MFSLEWKSEGVMDSESGDVEGDELAHVKCGEGEGD